MSKTKENINKNIKESDNSKKLKNGVKFFNSSETDSDSESDSEAESESKSVSNSKKNKNSSSLLINGGEESKSNIGFYIKIFICVVIVSLILFMVFHKNDETNITIPSLVNASKEAFNMENEVNKLISLQDSLVKNL